MTEKPIFYYCATCRINFKTQRCPKCGKMGKPLMKVPTERDFSKDPSYFDYLMNQKKDKKE